MPLFGRRTRLPAIGQPNRVPGYPRSLTAAGFRITRRESGVVRRLVMPWQTRSFGYYDQLGEIKYAAQFYARMLAPLKLYAAEMNPETGEWEESEDPVAKAALDRIQDPGGGRTGLMAAYGRLMFLTGECYLFVTKDDESGDETWEVLSSDELRVQDGSYIRYRAPSLAAEEYRTPTDELEDSEAWQPVDGEAVAYRLWQRHPRFSYMADSTMQGVLDLCEELVILTKSVRAHARSRISGTGILFFDESISPPPDEPEPDEDVATDPFLKELTDAMMKPIADEGAASAVVPLTVRVSVPDNGKVSDVVHHLQLVDPTQLYPETGLRMECIQRIAIGLDMPPEILLGMQDSNHWTAWQIDEQTWKGHGQQKADQLVDDLTAAYFRPYLRDVEGWGERAKNFAIKYDATDIVNHPDRTKDAKDLYDKRVISKQALREAAGFDEVDAPSKEELAEMIGVATRDSSLAWYGVPSVKAGGVEPEVGEIVNATGDTVAPAEPGASTGAEVEAGPPAGSSQNDDPDHAVLGALVARVVGAADLATLRAREAAGARLLSYAKKDPELRAQLKDVRTGDIPSFLGRERVLGLRVPSERDLVSGARDLILDALRVWGIRDSKIQLEIAHVVEQHAARTLYDKRPRPLPESFATFVAEQLKKAK